MPDRHQCHEYVASLITIAFAASTLCRILPTNAKLLTIMRVGLVVIQWLEGLWARSRGSK